jgi:hypothetical protein
LTLSGSAIRIESGGGHRFIGSDEIAGDRSWSRRSGAGRWRFRVGAEQPSRPSRADYRHDEGRHAEGTRGGHDHRALCAGHGDAAHDCEACPGQEDAGSAQQEDILSARR